MQFTFTERKVNLSDDFRAYAEKKLSKLDKYFRNDTVTYVTVGAERGFSLVEVTVKHDNMYFRSSEKMQDVYAAVDSAVAVIERQIRKNKTRLEKRLRSDAFQMQDSGYEPVEEEKEFNIVRTKRFSIKPMTPEEAILQMNLLGHEFFVFKSMDDKGTFSVVYRRNDGGYGLIEND